MARHILPFPPTDLQWRWHMDCIAIGMVMLGVTDEKRTLKPEWILNVLQRCHLALLQTCATLDDEQR